MLQQPVPGTSTVDGTGVGQSRAAALRGSPVTLFGRYRAGACLAALLPDTDGRTCAALKVLRSFTFLGTSQSSTPTPAGLLKTGEALAEAIKVSSSHDQAAAAGAHDSA